MSSNSKARRMIQREADRVCYTAQHARTITSLALHLFRAREIIDRGALRGIARLFVRQAFRDHFDNPVLLDGLQDTDDGHFSLKTRPAWFPGRPDELAAVIEWRKAVGWHVPSEFRFLHRATVHQLDRFGELYE